MSIFSAVWELCFDVLSIIVLSSLFACLTVSFYTELLCAVFISSATVAESEYVCQCMSAQAAIIFWLMTSWIFIDWCLLMYCISICCLSGPLQFVQPYCIWLYCNDVQYVTAVKNRKLLNVYVTQHASHSSWFSWFFQFVLILAFCPDKIRTFLEPWCLYVWVFKNEYSCLVW